MVDSHFEIAKRLKLPHVWLARQVKFRRQSSGRLHGLGIGQLPALVSNASQTADRFDLRAWQRRHSRESPVNWVPVSVGWRDLVGPIWRLLNEIDIPFEEKQ
jgi:hypothetical protein